MQFGSQLALLARTNLAASFRLACAPFSELSDGSFGYHVSGTLITMMLVGCRAGPGLGHESTVWGMAFEESGERMVSCSDDCTLRVWSCVSRNGEAWWRLLTVLSGSHDRTIFSVDWSTSGAIASGAPPVMSVSGLCLSTPPQPRQSINAQNRVL